MDTPSTLSPIENPVGARVRFFVRAILVLAFAGLFVAGALSITKLNPSLALPCGGSHGCDVVNNHPSSKWFNVPVAYVGFLGYLFVMVLAALRSGMAVEPARKVALVGYLVSAFGALTSVGLQIYSLTVIHATCTWCLTSAALMVLLLIFHALEYGDRISGEAADGKGDFALLTALFVILGVSLTAFGLNLKRAAYQPPTVISKEITEKIALVPKEAHIFGNKEAPITIVEFADLMCPSCQQWSPKVKEFVAKHPKVRMVYRHFPLTQIHRMGSLSAAVAEAAAEKGKFWDFTAAIMATGENMETPERVFEVAESVGLDPNWIKKQLEDETGPPMTRLTNDINAANALGLTQTPTFLVQVKGMETEAYGFSALMDALQNGKYKSLVEGGSPSVQ